MAVEPLAGRRSTALITYSCYASGGDRGSPGRDMSNCWFGRYVAGVDTTRHNAGFVDEPVRPTKASRGRITPRASAPKVSVRSGCGSVP